MCRKPAFYFSEFFVVWGMENRLSGHVSTAPGATQSKLFFSCIKVGMHAAPGMFTYVFHLHRS